MDKQIEPADFNPGAQRGAHGEPVGVAVDPDRKALSSQELDAEQAAELPDREAMSLVNANIAVPVNLAAALNVLSDGSIAYANAEQTTPIDQSQ